jgi:CobQ-like glutamine amidotransferase family enzyme
MLRGFLFLFLVLSIATACAATTYYVDDQAGDDQNTGVTPTCAWKTLEKVGAQHTRLLPGDTVRFRCGGHWRGPLWSKSGEPNQPITYASYGTGDKPQILGSIALDQTNDWIRHSETIWRTRQRFESDIGILVADHGKAWGWKRWSLATLQHPFDFWYDPAEKYVYLSASQNPATQCASLELGITRHIILLTSHDVVYEGLDLRYSGGHAIGGGNTVRVTIRNCDLSWCGGGGQDSGQNKIQEDLLKIGQKLIDLANNGAPMLVICGLYQLFGKFFQTADGKIIKGIGLFDAETYGKSERLIGNIITHSEQFGDIIGYENHSGQTFLGHQVSALGSVRLGAGNNLEDISEGVRYRNVIGSYLHGSLLPKNPAIADFLIKQAAINRYGKFEGKKIDDTICELARKEALKRPR